MKLIILVACAIVAIAVAAPVDEPPKILKYTNDQNPDGSFSNSFETENGISSQSQGQLKEVVNEDNKPVTVLVVRGSYVYTDPEGKSQSITYYADEEGFHAEGDSIPKASVV